MRYSSSKYSVTLKTGLGVVQGHWKMAPFDRPCTTFYQSAIVNIAVSGTFLSYLTLTDIMTLKPGLEDIQGHSNLYHSKAWVRFPIRLPQIVTMALSCIMWETKPRYWSKIVIFSYPLAFDAPSQYCHPVWCGKTGMMGLSDSGKSLRICITV